MTSHTQVRPAPDPDTATADQGLPAPAIAAAQALLEAAGRDRKVLSALAGGGAVAALESAFAAAVGAPFAVAVASGTAALHAALLVADVGPGDEVIVAAYGWGQTVAAVLATGATPVFADATLETGNLDPDSVAACIGPTTRAILATHLFGCPAPMDRLQPLAREHGLVLLADAAQALGAELRGQPLGAWADLTGYSLGAGKVATAGEGGMVVCHSADHYERLLLASQHPLRALREIEDPGLRGSVRNEFGLSYRLTHLQASLALAELAAVQERVAARRRAAESIARALSEEPRLILDEPPATVVHSYHQIVARFLGEETERQDFVESRQAQGWAMRCGPVQCPLHLRPPFQPGGGWFPRGLAPRAAHPSWQPGSCPNAERRCQQEVRIERARPKSIVTSMADEIGLSSASGLVADTCLLD